MTPPGGAARVTYMTNFFCDSLCRRKRHRPIALLLPCAPLFLPNPDDKFHHRAPPNTAPRIDSLGLHECAIGAR
jgi:hypothetical protein